MGEKVRKMYYRSVHVLYDECIYVDKYVNELEIGILAVYIEYF